MNIVNDAKLEIDVDKRVVTIIDQGNTLTLTFDAVKDLQKRIDIETDMKSIAEVVYKKLLNRLQIDV